MKAKNKKKKSNASSIIISILVILISACIIASAFFLDYLKSSPEDKYFDSRTLSTSKMLYSSIMSLNDENYPVAPEDVVTIYSNGFHLLYGNMIVDDIVIPDILRQQRKLLSQEVLDTNSLEAQEAKLQESLAMFKESSFSITSITILPMIYDKDNPNRGYVRVSQLGSDFTKYNWNYYVERDDKGFWKIIGWKKANENFMEN